MHFIIKWNSNSSVPDSLIVSIIEETVASLHDELMGLSDDIDLEVEARSANADIHPVM